ncbi:ABC transporter substrate-binding protein [Thiosulfativibrio zosterae]|nr:ABC transporter substrate-binding protein [Thiosulfativibrio zosterae]
MSDCLMLTRRQFTKNLFALSALSSVPLLSSCEKTGALRIGIHPWVGYESLYLAEESGELPNKVKLVKTQGNAENLALLSTGEIDGGTFTVDEVLLARSQGIPLVIVMLFDISAGADQVLTKTGGPIKAGNTVAYEPSAVGTLLFYLALERQGLTPKDVFGVRLAPSYQLNSWLGGELDAAITYEPHASKLKAAGAKEWINSRQFPDTITDTLAVRADRLPQFELTLRELIKTHFKIIEAMRINPDNYLYRIASHQEITYNQAKQGLAGIILPSILRNYELLAERSGFRTRIAEINILMTEEKLIPQADNLENLILTDYLPVPAGA